MKKYENYTKEQLIQKIKQLESKKYGLVWDDEKELEKVVIECQNNIPILKKIDKKTIKTDIEKPTNILIEGDNYHALQVLNYTHKGQIDVIYIDPPYNTGNKDFKYNDSFVDKEDGYRHSKWLNFMNKRLKLAHNLLKEEGLIFISIDDNEMAQLKLLCDDVFNEKNFIGNIAWESKTKSQNTKDAYNKLQPKVEHILCYSKNRKIKFNLFSNGLKEYQEVDKNGCFRYSLVEQMNASGIRGRNSMIFPINGIEPDVGKQWKIGIDSIGIYNDREDIEIIDNKPYIKIRPIDENQEKFIPFWAFFSKEEGTAEIGKRELTNILNYEHGFETVKPLNVIYKLIYHSSSKNSTILDFFAGSGTTGHAILELNKEDGGNRQFILCTNNENSICEEVTYPRISKVINGYKTPKGVDIDGISGNLDYYKTDLIPTNGISSITDTTREELTKKAGNMIAIKENTHFMLEICEHYQIFINKSTKKQTAIYFTEDLSCFDELIEKTKAHFTKLYIFSFGKIDKSSYKYLGKNYQIEDIPEPIIEIYKEINKEENL